MSFFAKVVILGYKIHPLYYNIPEQFLSLVNLGSLVFVPLKKRVLSGFVIEIIDKKPENINNILAIEAVAPYGTFFDKQHIDFYNFVSAYYSMPPGIVYQSAFPNLSLYKAKQNINIKTNNPLDPVLEFLSKTKGCTLDRLFKKFPHLTYKHITELQKKGFIDTSFNVFFKKIFSFEDGIEPSQRESSYSFTTEQKSFIDEVVKASYKPVSFLLFGKTGTGKTELLISLTEIVLSKGMSVLYLVPEISLTMQIFNRLTFAINSKNIVLWHSSLPIPAKRYALEKMKNMPTVVIGTRSSIFLPIINPGLVIVDEEHETSYKNETYFPYNARDMALARSKFFCHPVILSSATPSLETYYKAKTGKIKLFTLKKRFSPKNPEIIVLDTEKLPLEKGFFSKTLLNAIKENLLKQEQSLLFINRRGYVPYAYCNECKNFILCKFCTVPLTWHKSKNFFSCHRCGYKTNFHTNCPSCGRSSLSFFGAGTERICELLHEMFPQAKILKVDRESTERPEFFKKQLQDMIDGKFDILVATQILAKGHHFPKLTLVGVLLGDQGLHIPDFRAQEKTFQLLTQVFGRAGRELPGKVIIQTSFPTSPAITYAINENVEGFFADELSSRESTNFPPFTRLLLIKIKSKHENEAQEAANKIYEFICAKKLDCQYYPPMPAPIYRERGFYRYQLYVKAKSPKTLISLVNYLKKQKLSNKVHVIYDIDPYNLL